MTEDLFVKGLETVQRYHMLHQGDRVVAGVSGGADSVALLCFLCALREQGWDLSVEVCHINHCLRGVESDGDEAFVRQLCRRKEIPFHLLRVDAARASREMGRSLEEGSRELRYRFFARTAAPAEGGPPAKIATAHTLTDSMETVFFHLARGTGLGGLCGIPPRRQIPAGGHSMEGAPSGDAQKLEIVRPLVFCSREMVERYLEGLGQPFRTDSTNLSDDYARNRIRHQILPTMYQVHPGFDRSFAGMAELNRQENDYLNGLARALLTQAGYVREHPLKGCSAQVLAQGEPVLLRRAALLLLGDWGLPQERRWVEAILAGLERGRAGLEVRKGCLVRINGGRLWLDTAPSLSPEEREDLEALELPLQPGEYQIFPGCRVKIQRIDGESLKNLKKFHGYLLKNAIDCDMIDHTAILRLRRPGDRIALVDRSGQRTGSKSLKKLLNERRIPAESRGRLPLVAAGQDVLWMDGVDFRRESAVTGSTRAAWLLEVQRTGPETPA